MRNTCLGALVAVAALLAPSTASAQEGRWLRAESPSFIVYGTSSEAAVRGVVESLESFDALLRRMTGVTAAPSPARLEIYLYDGEDEFLEAFPGTTDWVSGMYMARPDIVGSHAIYRSGRGFEAQDILFHEYAHHFMHQYLANTYPSWYVEGFAEFTSTTDFDEDRTLIGRGSSVRASWLRAGSWIPMQSLLTLSPLSLDAENASRYYAQAWLFTHYLFMTPGMGAKLLAYLNALRRGAAPLGAFVEGFGMSPEEMEVRLRTYGRLAPNAIALRRPSVVEHSAVTITRLSASADTLVALNVQIRTSGAEARDSSTLLNSIRQRAGDAPADRFAIIALARAEAVIGDTARARALLEPYLAVHAEDVEAIYIMGVALLREARAASGSGADALYVQARQHFTRASTIDSNYVPALYRYVESFADAVMYDDDLERVLEATLRAHELAPQIQEISFYAASLLMLRGRAAEAIPMLRIIAYDPHGGNGANAARQMLSEAEGKAEPAQETPPLAPPAN